MAYYEGDRALQEMHDELYKREEQKPKSSLVSINKKARFWIALAGGALLLLLYFGKITTNQALLYGGVGALIVFLTLSGEKKRNELAMLECLIRVYDLLRFIQQHPIGDGFRQVPDGEIRVKLVGKKQWYQGESFKRSFAVDIYDQERDVTEMYFCEVDIFTGDIITFRYAPEGVIGDEKKDVVLMPTPDMLLQKKRDQYFGKSFYGK